MAQNIDSMIGGLKKNVAKGFALTDHYEMKSECLELMLVKSWGKAFPAEGKAMAWEFVEAYTVYQSIDSAKLRVYSKIRDMPMKGYTNKKGVKVADYTVPAHYTQGGKYLGTVKVLGDEPVSYPMRIAIGPKNFVFRYTADAETMADYFVAKDKVDAEGVRVLDAPKKTYKADRKAVSHEMDENYKRDNAKLMAEMKGEELDEEDEEDEE